VGGKGRERKSTRDEEKGNPYSERKAPRERRREATSEGDITHEMLREAAATRDGFGCLEEKREKSLKRKGDKIAKGLSPVPFLLARL